MEKLKHEEIKKRIEELKAFIKEKSQQDNFVLNQEVCKAQKEIATLQDKCSHEVIKDHVCTACGRIVFYDD